MTHDRSLAWRGWLAIFGAALFLLALVELGRGLFAAQAFPNLGQRLMFVRDHASLYAAAWIGMALGALALQPLVLALPRVLASRGLARAGAWLLFAGNVLTAVVGLGRGLGVPRLARTFAEDPARRTEAVLAFQRLEGALFGLDVFVASAIYAVGAWLCRMAVTRTSGAPRSLAPLLGASGVLALACALEELVLHRAWLHPRSGAMVHDYNWFAAYAAVLAYASIVASFWIARRDA